MIKEYWSLRVGVWGVGFRVEHARANDRIKQTNCETDGRRTLQEGQRPLKDPPEGIPYSTPLDP